MVCVSRENFRSASSLLRRSRVLAVHPLCIARQPDLTPGLQVVCIILAISVMGLLCFVDRASDGSEFASGNSGRMVNLWMSALWQNRRKQLPGNGFCEMQSILTGSSFGVHVTSVSRPRRAIQRSGPRLSSFTA